MTIHIPDRVDRYTILERLAIGGMAVVYLAFETSDKGLQRLVVIKQILPQLGEDVAFRNMFLQEARLAALINHPNVVEIYGLGTWEEEPYIAMEYVAGIPVNALMRQVQQSEAQFPVGVAIGIALQAAAGAHEAHEMKEPSGRPANLVHRDLTPHNLVVTERGHVKVLDFGVAKAESNMDKTETGMLKGKLPYMSPEQLWQKPLDRRSDLFTLGVVLWEMLLGKRLYVRDTEVATINAVLNSTLPAMVGTRKDVPEAVLTVAKKALERERDQRYPTTDAFRRDLASTAREAGIDFSEDVISEFVTGLLGDSLEARRKEVQERIDETMDTLHSTPVSGVPGASSTMAGMIAQAPEQTTSSSGAKWGLLLGALSMFVLGVFLVFGMWLWGTVSIEDPSDEVDMPTGSDVVQILIAPTVDPEILSSELEPLRLFLQRFLAKPVAWSIASSYEEASLALLDGSVAFASLPPSIYVQTHAANPRVQLVAAKIHAGSQGSDAVMLVAEESDIDTVEQVRGRRICYTDPHSTTGYLLPRAKLREHGIDPDKDLSGFHISGNHLQAIRDLIDGRCDVAGTFTAAYSRAEQVGVNAARTRVLALTGRTPHDAICAGPDVAPEAVQQMRDALLAFEPQRDAGVPSLGEMERLTGFAETEDAK